MRASNWLELVLGGLGEGEGIRVYLYWGSTLKFSPGHQKRHRFIAFMEGSTFLVYFLKSSST
jgi:hypothetical protein